jgi:anaerobic ribonucleoside-triphosphate reductase
MQTRNKITLKEQERQRCEVWTRVMGYYRPVSQFNLCKQSEFAQRQFFVETVQIPIAN